MSQMYCYVADLLGFKNMILNLPLKEQADRVKDWIQFVSEGINKFNLPEHQLVSDTIFIGAIDNDEGLENLLKFSKFMLENGIKKSFLLRGAISYGDVTWSKHISYGKAIVDAYNFANNMNWIGTACLPNVIKDNSPLYTSDLIVAYIVPMKQGDVMGLPAVIWSIPEFQELLYYTTGGGLYPKGANPLNHSYLSKIQNTELFSQYVQKILSNNLPHNQIYGCQPLELVVSDCRNVNYMCLAKRPSPAES